MPNIITCTGYGNTGSSAGTNFFEEFEGIKSYGSSIECTFLHEADGLLDLESAIKEGHRLKVDLAVKRFLKLAELTSKSDTNKIFNGKLFQYSKKYIEELCNCKWKGNWHRAFEVTGQKNKLKFEIARFFFNKNAKKIAYSLYESDSWKPQYLPYTDMYYASYDTFEEITKKYIAKLFSECDKNTEYNAVLIDQLIPPIASEQYTTYFDSIKTIVIDRDPRDLYYMNKVFWGSRYIPTSDVSTFIKWFKSTRKDRKIKQKNTLYITLEDLVYKYENTKNELIQFTNLNEKTHSSPFKFFDPSKSIVNTRKWLQSDLYKDDITLIEKELADYCFDYAKLKLDDVEKKEVTFVFEDTLRKADAMQEENISFIKKIEFCLFDLESLPISRILKHIKENSKKNPIREIIKLGIFLARTPFDYIKRFIKTMGQG